MSCKHCLLLHAVESPTSFGANVVPLVVGQKELVVLEAELIHVASIDHDVLGKRQIHGAATWFPFFCVEDAAVVSDCEKAPPCREKT